MTPARRVPRVIAHRGASRDLPDNSIAAFDEAVRLGCDGIELDVQCSRDGVPVAWHDRTLYGAGGGMRRVASLDLAELRRLEVGPTLRTVLERYGSKVDLLVEIKTRLGSGGMAGHRRLARAVVDELREAGLLRRAWILGFDRRTLDHVGELAPGSRRVLNLEPPARPPRGFERSLDGLAALSAKITALTPRWARAVRETGRPLFCYTVNDRRRLRMALEADVDGIMSDRPGWLRRSLRRDA